MSKIDYLEATISGEDRLEQKRLHNKKLIPYNIIIAVVSLAAILSLVLGNFLTIDYEYYMDSQTLEEMIVAFNGGTPDGMDIDYEALDINVAFALSLDFKSTDLIKAAYSDTSDTVSLMLDSVLNNVFDTAQDLIKQVFNAGIKIAIVTAFNTLETSEETSEFVNHIDLEPVEAIVTELFEEEPDTEQIGEDLLALIREQIEASGETFTQEMETEIMDAYNNTIDSFSDEDGNFSIMTAIGIILTESAGVELDDTTDISAMTQEQMLVALKAEVAELLDDEVQQYMAIVYKAIAGYLIFHIVLWSILLLSAILRIFTQNKRVRLWYIILCGAFPFLTLYALPTIAVKLATKFYDGEGAEYISDLAIKFSSITFVAAICTLVLLLMSIFSYRKLKRNAKNA